MQVKIRLVKEEDCYDIYSWRNHPVVRRGSFNTDEIPREEHKRWFDKKVKDEKTRIYIAEDENERKIGQARFEENKDEVSHINVNLNPHFFGKGLGSRVISSATEYYLKEKSNIKRIIAEVKGDNIASQKAFEKAGYIFREDAKREDKNFKIFIYSR